MSTESNPGPIRHGDEHLEQAPGVLSRPVSRGLVLSLPDGRFLRLPLATEVVWQEFAHPASPSDVSRRLRSEFELPGAEADLLVDRAVAELLELGLLTRQG